MSSNKPTFEQFREFSKIAAPHLSEAELRASWEMINGAGEETFDDHVSDKVAGLDRIVGEIHASGERISAELEAIGKKIADSSLSNSESDDIVFRIAVRFVIEALSRRFAEKGSTKQYNQMKLVADATVETFSVFTEMVALVTDGRDDVRQGGKILADMCVDACDHSFDKISAVKKHAKFKKSSSDTADQILRDAAIRTKQ